MSHHRPNIIFLMTDQQRWDCIGKFNEHIYTPTLDKLAENGIVFSQAVCQAPMCVPSRSSMMFGLYPSQLGVRTNHGGLYDEDQLPALPLAELLRREGYQTAGFGKTHWNHGLRNANPPTRGFEVRAVGLSRDSGHYEEGAVMMGDDDPEGLQAYSEETRHYGSGEENALGYIGCTSQVPMHRHRDGWVAEQCKSFIANGIDSSRPLFLYLSFLKPHAGFNVPKEFEDWYRLEDIPDIEQPPWETEPDTHVSEPDVPGSTYWERRKVWEGMSRMERRRTTLRYWANCSWLDHYFGQVLEGLEAKGILDNALIVFVSDHGEMLGERQFRFSKYCLYESSVRVPMMLAGSWVPEAKRGTVDERPAELIDLVPTLARAAGAESNPLLPGLDLLGDQQRVGAFCEFHRKTESGLFAAPAFMWRKQDWKLILYLPGTLQDAVTRIDELKGELYHLKEDPHEWHNGFQDERWHAIRERMTAELLMHLMCAWTRGPFFYDNQGVKALGH
ncbi:sulfatase [Paenibacillus sp. GCM10023248]|uniref:sulfatase family protein n=1 Tax=Bacillales TaxID=1385 RepID=UPI0023798394|nr:MULTISPECIES: sulfatase-like hydrolase/transferase [Bacillales]MDD9269386.1 sulfatase-like hydrolase/transferase [Paenibacillus sp. MAHUQ-63]MDR6880994.1 arylsulfatase A-like enzyme [Bacillus sp. 3255]